MADEPPINQEAPDAKGGINPLLTPEETPKAAPSLDENEGDEDGGELPQVGSANKAKNYLVLGGIALFALVMIGSLLFGGKSKPPAEQNLPGQISGDVTAPAPPTELPSLPAQVQQPVANNPLPVPSVNEPAPEPLPLPAPEGLPPIASPAEAPPAPAPAPSGNAQDEAKRLASGMLIAGGTLDKLTNGSGGSGGAEGEKKRKTTVGTTVEISESDTIGDTTNMVAQGKMIDAVMESAINSDFPGVIRAIVSRDVYAESGRKVLIAKGSRLIGAYNSSVKQGQARIYIIWNRVIMPNGIDITLDSPGTDLLGRSGVNGVVDAHYMEIFGNSLLFSAIDLGFVAAAQGLTGAQGSTTTTSPGGVTTTSQSPVSQELGTDITNFGGVTKGVLGNLINTNPTITLDQGTPIKVFVNRDLIFNQSTEDSATGVFK